MALADFSRGVGIAGHSMGGQATLHSSEAGRAAKHGISAAAMLHAWTHDSGAVPKHP